MRVTFIQDSIIEAKVTETTGRHIYVVASSDGGVWEMPIFHYYNYQIIRANSIEEARKKYLELNVCDYYNVFVLGEIK